jgi:tetratricopeptide (TPR) repeat protein
MEAVLGFNRTGQVDRKRPFEPLGKARFLMRYQLAFLLILGFATPEYRLQAQSLECGADDGQCLIDSLGLACSHTLEAFEETCLAWVQRVEAHPLAANAEWKLVAAAAYYSLAELADSEAAVQGYSERSRAINQDVLTRWSVGPFASEAYVGLSNLVLLESEDVSEVIRLGRMAVAADPEHDTTMWLLANWLVQRGESGDLREAADLYRSAYVAGGSRSWYWAANALSLYRSTGQQDQIEIFLKHVTRDSGMDGFVEEVVSSRFARDPERAAAVLETACHSYVIAIFGPETCLNGIDNLVEATRLPIALAERQSIVDAAIPALRGLAAMGGGSAAEPRGWHDRFGALLQEWVDSEVATAAVYFYWAGTQSNVNAAVSGYETAVRLAPGNGEYRYRLARAIFKQGRLDEAIEQLGLARDTLPARSGITVESVDRQMRIIEMAR